MAPALWFDSHERAKGKKPREFDDIAVVDRDAACRPVDVANIEDGIVGAVDADLAAFTDAAKNFAILAQLGEADSVNVAGTVDTQEVSETPARMLGDDVVGALARAAVAFS